jgi:anti-sigma-K factor RskA
MNTTTLHLKVQRSRFSHHALATLARIAPAPLRSWFTSEPLVLSVADKASQEAQKVRELASSYSKTDPGFASDLYAAAARHEGLHG